MGLVVQVICLVLKLCAISIALVVQGSAEGTLGHSTCGKPLRSNAPGPASLTNGSVLHPPPLNSAPAPQTIKGILPSLSPSTPTVLLPYSSVPPLSTVQGVVPSSPPTGDQRTVPSKAPALVPLASVPVASPSRNSPQNPPTIHPIMRRSIPPRSIPPSSPQNRAPDTRPPPSLPIAPVPVGSPAGQLPRISPTIDPTLPE
ncbi:hypothetical protein F0562_009672 [Nyssa sinensis]|uniref:Uncharacterized protein n=1 Tax=Nyssa sinensis TaxID=561372 RepID=A0A5J4ZYX0_9ASTE|nr:hypothetical protein F0562_009672 [Nyssa sinensis]